MKKLLIATDNFLPRWDGIARVLSEIIPRLQNHYEITVVGPDFGELEDQNFKLIRFPLNKHIKVGDFMFSRPDHSVLKRLVKESDIVFTQTIGPIGAKTIRLAKALRRPVAAFIHSIEHELAAKAVKGYLKKYASNIVKRRAKKLYNKCNLLLVPSQQVEEILQWQNIHTQTAIVHLGVNTKAFSPPENKLDAKQALDITPEDFIIGYHGRLGREKDLLTLFRAFIRFQSKVKHAKLLVVGDGLIEIKNMLNRRQGVILVSAKSNVQAYLQAMDVYVLTSLTETTSLSTLEAMSCELPVIATRVGFVQDYILEGVNGFLVDLKQPFQIMKKLELLYESKTLRERLGKAARKTVTQKFTWDLTVEKIKTFFDEL